MQRQHGISLLLILIAFVWAGSFVVVKAISQEIDPIFLGFLRFIVATPLMLLVLLIQKKSIILKKQLLPHMALLGLSGVTLLYLFQFIGISLTTAATAGVLINTNVIFIALLSFFTLKEKINKTITIGILISFAGVIIVITSQSSNGAIQLSYEFILGALLVMLSALCWAIYSIIGKHLLKDYDSISITTTAFLWGTLFYIPFLPAVWNSWTSITIPGWGAIIYLALVCSVFGYLGWYYALKHIPASKAAVYLNLIPLFTILLALLFGEIPTYYFLIGAALIIYGVYLTQHG